MEDLILELKELLKPSVVKTPEGYFINWKAAAGLAAKDVDNIEVSSFALDIYDTKHILHKLVAEAAVDYIKFLREVYFTVKDAKSDLAREDYTHIEVHINKLKVLRG